MPRYHVQIGSLDEIHVGLAPIDLDRGRRVIVRSRRGVELGRIVSPVTDPNRLPSSSHVQILRPTTEQDELLIGRLQRHKREAVEACREELSRNGSSSLLLDVDQIFDGGTLIMHFLGPVDEVAQSITQSITQRYESIVRSRHFAKLLREGCGPDCGTGESDGCSGTCTGCAVSGACAG